MNNITLTPAPTSDIELLESSWTNSCGMLHHEGGCERAPEGWGVNPEEERNGTKGREFYHYDTGATVFVPMLPEGEHEAPKPGSFWGWNTETDEVWRRLPPA